MTNKQRRILEDAEISSELMHEVDHYLKDVGAVLSGTIHEKENYLTMLCNDIAEFVDVNPSASINNIIGIVYACALIENHWINKGYDTESIENEEVVILQTDERD